MKAVNLKELGSYSLLFVIASNILLYSSALKTAQGDYYIAFEIMRNMNLQSWLTGNIATLMLLISAIILPLVYYILHAKIQRFQKCKKMQKNRYILLLFTCTTTIFLFFWLFTECILGFHGVLIIILGIYFISALTQSAFHYLLKDKRGIDMTLKIYSSLISIILFIGCVIALKDSSIIGQSCLLQVKNDVTKKIATIVPIDYSEDSLKAIFLKNHQEVETKNKQAAYISILPVDETFSIYPNTCDSIYVTDS